MRLVHDIYYVHVTVNKRQIVNINAASFERALLARLREILADLAWPAEFLFEPEGFDAAARLRTTGGKYATLFVECKKDLRPAAFPTWAKARAKLAAERRGTPLLGQPVVSARMAELCRESGWSWLDLSGNCRIDVPGLLHIERSGAPPIRRPHSGGANLGTAAAARVLRVLLSPGCAGRLWTQRDLQSHTCWGIEGVAPVSLGLVNKVIRHLLDEGFVERMANRGIRVRDPAGLLAAWGAAYRFDRHERRGYFTLLKGSLAQELYKVALGAAEAMVYAAFSAAERQAAHVRQPKTWVYVSPPYLDALVDAAEAKEVDSGENLVVLLPEDPGVFLSFEADSADAGQTIPCTDPVQTYVDLLYCGGRGEEGAQALLEQRILPAWKAVSGE